MRWRQPPRRLFGRCCPAPVHEPGGAVAVLGPRRSSTTATSMSSATEDSDAMQVSGALPRRRSTKRKSKIIKPLGNLGVYTQGIKFTGFSSPESKAPNHVFSFPERRFEGLCRDPETKAQLEKHNMRYLMRVYPSAFRVRSTNPDPLLFWRRGTQMVALNWQTYDLGMQLNDAMFACGADRSGYVLKPRGLRHPIPLPDPFGESSVLGGGTTQPKLHIQCLVEMISAQQLPQPWNSVSDETLHPYVEIEMLSAEDKTKGAASSDGGMDNPSRPSASGTRSSHRARTEVVSSNGYNPIFNEKFKLQVETRYPELIFVRWTVWTSQESRNTNSTDLLATFTAKLSRLEEGYRHIPLYDHNGDQFLFATLFCRIQKEPPVVVEQDEPVAAKVGGFRQSMQSVFNRSLSVDKKRFSDNERKGRRALTKAAPDD